MSSQVCNKCGEYYIDMYSANYEWCKPCQMNHLKNNFLNWSGNEKVDDFIQEMQLNINDCHDIIFEWIPYDQFDDIKIGNDEDFVTMYSAIWKEGSLDYDKNKNEYTRSQNNKTVALKCLHDSRNIITEFIKEINAYSIKRQNEILYIYGISQNPVTEDYLMVLEGGFCEKCCKKTPVWLGSKWCKSCQMNYLEKNFITWTSGNEAIDCLIQEMRLKIDSCYNAIFEWIPINQFNNFKEIGKSGFDTIYSATWKDGPLEYVISKKEWERKSDKQVSLRYLCNSQNITNEFLNNKVKPHSLSRVNGILGMSQHPDTKDYILVLQVIYCEKCGMQYTNMENICKKWCTQCQVNYLKKKFTNWTSGNDEIDNLIQEMQLNINYSDDVVFEWIPYNQINDIKKIDDDDFSIMYSATWKVGPLEYDIINKKEWIRKSDKKVALKCLHDPPNGIDEFLNEVKEYLSDELNSINIYGITQNPNTKNYIMVLLQNEYCEKCGEKYIDKYNPNHKLIEWCQSCQINRLKEEFLNWSGNERIDKLIRDLQLKINDPDDVVFEWIPYNQFNNIKVVGKGGFAVVYSAIWNDGLLTYDQNEDEWTRNSDEKVALKHLNNSQDISNEFLNEVKAYSNNEHNNIIQLYGISQNPITNDYIIVFEYAEGGNLDDWMNKNYKDYNWYAKLITLSNIINGLLEIHKQNIVHRDLHTGNILFRDSILDEKLQMLYISDMGLCGAADNTDETNIYGVLPYIAPEVLRGEPYTQATDIYSFGMIMYFVATEKQPFSNYAHDHHLISKIWKGIRPEIHEQKAPKWYIDLMKRCWNSNPDNRPNAIEINDLLLEFDYKTNNETIMHFEIEEAEKYRKANLLSIESNESNENEPIITSHPLSFHVSRKLNEIINKSCDEENIGLHKSGIRDIETLDNVINASNKD